MITTVKNFFVKYYKIILAGLFGLFLLYWFIFILTPNNTMLREDRKQIKFFKYMIVKKTRKEKILALIEQRQHQLHYPHEREYLATLLDNMMEKELNQKIQEVQNQKDMLEKERPTRKTSKSIPFRKIPFAI